MTRRSTCIVRADVMDKPVFLIIILMVIKITSTARIIDCSAVADMALTYVPEESEWAQDPNIEAEDNKRTAEKYEQHSLPYRNKN